MHSVKALRQSELEGRTYSATLVSAIGEILREQGITLGDIGCLVVVNGPGSFTGVRVGLSAAKGLAEPHRTPVVAVSRLEALARKAGVLSSALDAHRHEIFLRLADPGRQVREMLAGAVDLALTPPSSRVAVCDDGAAAVLEAAWPGAILIKVAAPSAMDALALAAPEVSSEAFVDLALLDGHYLRRSDAEIFGPPATRPA
jgi:tRNA threonylcarbamoyladenosine biosynthesis protein TsaB